MTMICLTSSGPLGDYPWTVISTNLLGLIAFAWLIVLASKLGKGDASVHLHFLLLILGALIGTVLGILASPYSDGDKQQFAELGQAISAFLAGYVVSKLDRFLEASLFKGEQPKESAWIRVTLFCTSLFLWAVVVFIDRWYLKNVMH